MTSKKRETLTDWFPDSRPKESTGNGERWLRVRLDGNGGAWLSVQKDTRQLVTVHLTQRHRDQLAARLSRRKERA